jgi:hypothetical protein
MHHDVTLRQSLMTRGFNEQRQKDLLALGFEDRQKGNAGYYLPARIELEIRDTDDRAQALYDACCEVWEIHGLTRTRAFYRAILDNCLETLFSVRRACVQAELTRRDKLMNAPGRSSAALGSLARRMQQLRSTWNTKLEKEARDSEIRERLARERTIQFPLTPVSSAPGGTKVQAFPKSKAGRKRRLQQEFIAFARRLWREKQGSTRRVSATDLRWIADQLDMSGYTPPADYLETKAAKDLKGNNSKKAHSRAGAILRWSDLVARGDKESIRAMRKTLSRCAGKLP